MAEGSTKNDVGGTFGASQGDRNIRYLSDLAERLDKAKKDIKELERQIKIKVAERELLEKTTLPDFMMELGLPSCVLANGLSVEVKPFYYARIPVAPEDDQDAIAKRNAAFAWLREHKFGGMIKEKLEVMPDASKRDLILEFCKEMEIPYDSTESVHHKTLESWLKEQVTTGNKDLPMELFNGYVGRIAVVK